MFEENDWDDIGDLVRIYEQIKNGNNSQYLELEDYEIIVEYFLQNNKTNDALEACDVAALFHPFSIDLLLLKAEILYEAQRYGQAMKQIDKVLAIEEKNIPAVLLLSDILLAQDKNEEAIKLLNSHLTNEDFQNDITILHEISDIYDDMSDFESVYDTLVKILNIDPRNEEALHKICFWSDLTKKNEESVALHTEILEIDPFNTLAWFNLGAAHQALKNDEEAIDAFEYCIALDDKQESTYRNLADVYMRIKNYDKAIDVLEQILMIAKPEDVIYEAMGQCFDKKRNYAKARYFYKEAIKLNPADDFIFSKIGNTYMREGNYESAFKSYSSAYKLNNKNPNYAYAMGNCLLELSSEKEAIICFLNAITLKQSHKNAWLGLVKSLYQLELYSEALLQLDLAEENCGPRAEFEMMRTASLFQIGKTKDALISFENGMEMSPSKFKLLQELQPDILKRKSIADILANYKKK